MTNESRVIDYLKRMLTEDESGDSLSYKEFCSYQTNLIYYLHLSDNQRGFVEKKEPDWRVIWPSDFFLYVVDRKEMFFDNELMSIRKLKKQFIDDKLKKFGEYQIFYELQKRFSRPRIKKQISFPKMSQLTVNDIDNFLNDFVILKIEGTVIAPDEERFILPLVLYSADSEYDHPIFLSKDMCTLCTMIEKHFGTLPSLKTLAEALTKLLPKDLYGQISYSLSDAWSGDKDGPQELRPDKDIPSEQFDRSILLSGREQAETFWERLRLSDKFIVAGRFRSENKTAEDIRHWGESYGVTVPAFYDRQKVLRRERAHCVQDLTGEETEAFYHSLEALIMEFEQEYPWPS